MKRISVTISEELAEALEKIVKLDPLKTSKSMIVSEALFRYIMSKYPSLLKCEPSKGPRVIAALKTAKPHAPSPTLRRGRLGLPRWVRVEG